MSVSVTVTDHWTDGKRIHVIFSVTPTGNYTVNGDTLSFADPEIKSNSIPEFVSLQGQGVNNYAFIPGTTMANGKIFGQTGGVQFSAAAYPADTIVGHAIFPKFI